jgi:hypothetical protein
MTIIEAIKSGKRFRRKNQQTYYNKFGHWDAPIGWIFSADDVLADDWEVEEKKVEITKAQLSAAWNRLVDRFEHSGYNLSLFPTSYELAKELGLD